MNVNNTVVSIKPSNNLDFFFKKTNSKSYKYFEKFIKIGVDNIQNLRGRSIPLDKHPLKISNYFLFFILEVIQKYSDTCKDKNLSKEAKEVLLAFVNYVGYCATNSEFKKKLRLAIGEFCKKLEEELPLTSEIKKDFENWIQIFGRIEGMSFVDRGGLPHNLIQFPLSDFDNLRNRKKMPLLIKTEDCLPLIEKMITYIENILPLVNNCVDSILEDYSEKGIAESWKLPDAEFYECQEILLKDSEPGHRAIDFSLFLDPISLEKNWYCFEPCVPKRQLLNQLKFFTTIVQQNISSMRKNKENIVAGMNSIWEACKRVVLENNIGLERKDCTFSRNGQVQTKMTLENLKKTWEKKEEKDEKAQEAYSVLVNFIEERIKLAEKNSEAANVIETIFFSICDDFKRLVDAYVGRFPLSEAQPNTITKLTTVGDRENAKRKADLAMQQLIASEQSKPQCEKTRSTNRTGRSKKKGKNKRVKRQVIGASKAKKVYFNSISRNSATLQNEKKDFKTSVIVSNTNQPTEVLCRNLWYQYVQMIPHLLDNFSDKISLSNLFRFSVMALHGFIEQTLEVAAKKKGGPSQKTHNLWYYRNVVPTSLHSILETFYDAHNCARFGRELHHDSNHSLTLPYHSQVLEWLFKNSRKPMSQEVNDQIVDWMKEGESVFNHFSSVQTRKIQKKNVAPLENIELPSLDQILQKLKNADKTPWLEQWFDDLSDLQEMLNLIAKGNFPATLLPLFTEHMLMLTTGIVQSPLYALEMKKNGGKHSRHHDLELLWRENNLPTPKDSETFKNLLDGISTIHRYPFEGGVRSKAHRLYLNAIAIGFNPELDGDGGGEFKDNINVNLKEGELDKLRRPFLNKYLNNDDLRVQLIEWVKEVVAMTQEHLVKELL